MPYREANRGEIRSMIKELQSELDDVLRDNASASEGQDTESMRRTLSWAIDHLQGVISRLR